jgi:hypothetical protein
MTATLTLNDLTIEQASAVLTLLDEMKNCTITPEEARNGVELFPTPVQTAAIPTTTPAPVQTAAIPAAAPAPVQTAAIPTTTPAPVQTAAIPAAAPAPLPTQTAPQTYTVQQLGQAARPLMENGRQQELIGLLAEFGVQSVAALPENRRADFAARLRAMGGMI